MARVIAVSNQKGGVGKTTTAVNLSAALAQRGYKTLLLDLDPQGNASSGLGAPSASVEVGIYDVLLELVLIDGVRRRTAVENLDLVPAHRSLVGAEVELMDEPDRQRRVRKALARVRDEYDYILIDCPPSLGLLTINALCAADSVIVPLQAEYYAMEGLGELLRTIGMIKKRLNPDLVREGVLLTMHDARNNLARDVETQTRALFGHEVFDTVIPRNVRIGEAPSHGLPVVVYDPRCVGAKSYLALADELLRRNGVSLRVVEAS
jgi:chromosome partitioning protein